MTVPVTIEGISSVEVGAFYPTVTSSGQYDVSPGPGTTWAAIDATECAGTSGSSTGANKGWVFPFGTASLATPSEGSAG